MTSERPAATVALTPEQANADHLAAVEAIDHALQQKEHTP